MRVYQTRIKGALSQKTIRFSGELHRFSEIPGVFHLDLLKGETHPQAALLSVGNTQVPGSGSRNDGLFVRLHPLPSDTFLGSFFFPVQHHR